MATCGDCNITCYDVDACTPAACIEGSCQAWSNCGEGDIRGAEGCEPVSTGCSNAVLTGAQGIGSVCVDDALRVRVSSNEVFFQPSIFCQSEVSLGPLANGDIVSLEIYDDYPSCSMEPYQLVCLDTGEVQVLNAA